MFLFKSEESQLTGERLRIRLSKGWVVAIETEERILKGESVNAEEKREVTDHLEKLGLYENYDFKWEEIK